MAQLARAAGRPRVLHADHDGSGRRPRVPRRDEARAHPRRAGRRRSRSPPAGLKDVYKGFNLCRRRAGRAAAGVPPARRPRARVVHLRPAERRQGHLRRDGRAGRAGRPDVRAVRAADAVSRHARLREVGRQDTNDQRQKVDGVPITQHWLIPERAAAEALSPRIRRCRSRRSASARRAPGIEFYSWRSVWARRASVKSLQGAPGVRADLEAVSPDVREHRDRHRQRAGARSAKGRGCSAGCRGCSSARRCPNLAMPRPPVPIQTRPHPAAGKLGPPVRVSPGRR